MKKTTCWQGWSCYGLYLKTSEMPILKEGLENLLRKLHSEEGWQIVRGCLNAEGSFTKKYWKRNEEIKKFVANLHFLPKGVPYAKRKT
ncbi:MAG: hypothetical protein IKS21_01260 [Oscillospiraceae bacterium]|nr:hypothetical protein [Oscillospiraceae bacterium]